MIKTIEIDLPFEKILAERINPNTSNIGVVAIIKYKKQYLLVKNRKYPTKNWLFLTGKVEDNETADQAITREIKEETNLNIISIKKSAILKPKNIDNAKLVIFECETDGKIVTDNELTDIKLFQKIPGTIHPVCKLIIANI